MIEQRTAERFTPHAPLYATIRARSVAAGRFTVQNISKKGICVDAPSRLPKDEEFDIELGRGTSGQAGHFQAHVVWQDRHRAGFMFRLANQNEEFLEEILSQVK